MTDTMIRNRLSLCAVEKIALGLLVAVGVIAAAFASPRFLGGLLGGGLLAIVNFYGLRQLVAALISARRRPTQAALVGLLLAKETLLLGVFYLLLTRFPVDPIAVIVGVSLLVLAIFAQALRTGMPSSTDTPAELTDHG